MPDENATGDADEAATGEDVAGRALAKLRDFIASLDDDERAVLAALLAPGVAGAYQEDEPEVVGFGMPAWRPERLPASLADQVRQQHLRIEFG